MQARVLVGEGSWDVLKLRACAHHTLARHNELFHHNGFQGENRLSLPSMAEISF